MSIILNLLLMTTILLAIGSVSSSASTREINKRESDAPDSSNAESDVKDPGTVSPEEMEKLNEEIIENQAENAEKYDLPLTNSPEEVDAFLKVEEKEFGKELPEVVEEGFTDGGELKNFVHFVTLFDKIKNAGEEGDEEVVEKSPAEMEEMKEELFKLNNEFHEQHGLPQVSREDFDKVWDIEKEEYGKLFPGKVEAMIALLKAVEKAEEETTVKVVSESVPEVSTESSEEEEEEEKEEIPQDAFILRSAEGHICIIAKFQSAITIIYSGKGAEQKVEVSVPSSGETKGKCAGPNQSPSLQISWGKFIFALLFNKTSEDTWGVTTVELTYDTSEPLFDGAANRGKVTVKSKNVNLFETPFGKSCFCPAQEAILLYSENEHVATVRLKDVHMQPYDVEDGKLSKSHRCNQVVIGGPDQEPFVQDETIPLAVGCTLALITLLILVGFSVHRAYNAAKVDYNTME